MTYSQAYFQDMHFAYEEAARENKEINRDEFCDQFSKERIENFTDELREICKRNVGAPWGVEYIEESFKPQVICWLESSRRIGETLRYSIESNLMGMNIEVDTVYGEGNIKLSYF